LRVIYHRAVLRAGVVQSSMRPQKPPQTIQSKQAPDVAEEARYKVSASRADKKATLKSGSDLGGVSTAFSRLSSHLKMEAEEARRGTLLYQAKWWT